jgi:hypothetical protein
MRQKWQKKSRRGHGGRGGFFLPVPEVEGTATSLHPIAIVPGSIVFGVIGLFANLV